jgi:hypothetical protein
VVKFILTKKMIKNVLRGNTLKTLKQELQILDEISNIDTDIIIKIVGKFIEKRRKTRSNSKSKHMKVTCCPVFDCLVDELLEDLK